MTASGVSGLRIRRATTDDAARLATFASDIFTRTFGPQNDPADIAGYVEHAFGDEQQRAEIAEPSTLFWIAEDDRGDITGYVQLKIGSQSRYVTAGQQAEISRIYADNRYHGQGLGRALMDVCITAAQESGAAVIWLAVWEKNPRAIAFYEKNGFRAVGDQPFQLGSDLQRDIVMARELGT